MASTTHDEGFHEIQLNGKQLVFLFMAGTVVAVVIFLLGVFVGRGVRSQVGDTDPLAVAAQGADKAPDIPPVAASGGSEAPTTTNEILTYADQLAGKAPRETLGEKPRSAPAAAAAAPPAAAPNAATSAPAPSSPAASAPAPKAAPAAPSVATEPAGDGFAIQVAALAKREEAEIIVRRLGQKGYSAYLMAPAAGAASEYRVRVGKFKERREAESVSTRLQKEEQFKPWIVR